MAKLNQQLRARGSAVTAGPLTSEATSSGRTAQGGAGFARDAKSELFLLAVTNMVGENSFYETGQGRDDRFRDLVATVVAQDPQWTLQMLSWLRKGANMRTAALIGGIEAAAAYAKGDEYTAGVTPRLLAGAAMHRADEPAEALAYWHTRFGRTLPKWFKRALGDAAARLYTEYSYAKWDSPRNAVRMADVIELSHRDNRGDGDFSGLYRHILDARPGRSRAPHAGSTEGLPLLAARAALNAVEVPARRAVFGDPAWEPTIRAAGLTWEAVSGWIQAPLDAQAWERIIDLGIMPYGATIKNLGNLERVGIDRPHAEKVRQLLTDPGRVRGNRLLPMAYLNAYLNVPGDTFKEALDHAATLALSHVPAFTGRTLILVDTSSSMNQPMSTHAGRRRTDAVQLMRWDVAALFALALARRCADAEVVSYSDGYYGGVGSKVFTTRPGENLLSSVRRFRERYFIGGGTDTGGAVRRHYGHHDRVVLLTDEQTGASRQGFTRRMFYNNFGKLMSDDGGVFDTVPARVPCHTFNLAGDKMAHAASAPRRWSVGGLSDAGFEMMHALEAFDDGRWPWERQNDTHSQ